MDLDKLGIENILGFSRLEDGGKFNTPMSAQPEQRLDGDDGSAADKGPFFATNVLVVEIVEEVEAQEDRPNKSEGPDVGMEIDRQRSEKLSVFDVGAIDETRRHGGLGWLQTKLRNCYRGDRMRDVVPTEEAEYPKMKKETLQ